jgi:hypothetical protein
LINKEAFAPESVREEVLKVYPFLTKVQGTLKALPPINLLRSIFSR